LKEFNDAGQFVPYKTVGFGAQAKYSYKMKYLVELTTAYTGSENFARGSRFGFFPAISGGWIISEENFFNKNSPVSFLKARASYGVTGLDDPTGQRFMFRELWESTNGYAFGTTPSYRGGYSLTRVGNPGLKWETSYKTNAGVDLGFFNNKLLLTVDGFHDLRKDIMIQKYATVPGAAGIALPYENGGTAKSWGVDSEMSFTKTWGNNIMLNVRGNFMYANSKIIDISESFKTESYQYQKGHPIGQPFPYVSDGFFTEEELADYPILQNSGNIKAGDIKYKDMNNDGVIDDNDRYPVLSNSIPNLIYGLDFIFQYKQVDLAVQALGVADRYIYRDDVNRIGFNGDQSNSSILTLQAWDGTPEGIANAKYPRLSIWDNNNNRMYSDFWFVDGTYFRIKALELGYNLPPKALKALKIAKVRIYGNVNNLWGWDRCGDVGYDIETTNAAKGFYPRARTYTLGLNVVF
jgi:TonB-linked SusC/RagA family outer membrane protein